MNIGATICGFLSGVIFALVLMAIPPAIERFRMEARTALYTIAQTPVTDQRDCEA